MFGIFGIMESTRSFPPDLSVMFVAEREGWGPLIYVGDLSYSIGQGNAFLSGKSQEIVMEFWKEMSTATM